MGAERARFTSYQGNSKVTGAERARFASYQGNSKNHGRRVRLSTTVNIGGSLATAYEVGRRAGESR